MKAVLKGKFVAVNTYILKDLNNLIFHFKTLENKEQGKCKASRRRDIIRTGAENNEIENRKTVEKSTDIKVDSLERSAKLMSLIYTEKKKKLLKSRINGGTLLPILQNKGYYGVLWTVFV